MSNVFPRGARAACALALAAALAMLAAAIAPGGKAFGDVYNSAADHQVTIEVPVEAEFALIADGTLVGPSSYRIKNSGTGTAVLASSEVVPADGFADGLTLECVGKKHDAPTKVDEPIGYARYTPEEGSSTPETLLLNSGVYQDCDLTASLSPTIELKELLAGADTTTGVKIAEIRFTFANEYQLEGTITLTGYAVVGSTISTVIYDDERGFSALSGKAGGIEGLADGDLSFGWYRDGELIEGTEAIGKMPYCGGSYSYTLAPEDVGHSVTLRARDTESGCWFGGHVESNAIGPVTSPITGTVSLDKSEVEAGDAVTATVEGCNVPDDALRYEWTVSGEETATQHGEFTGSTQSYTVEVSNAPATLRIENVGPISSSQSAGSGISLQVASQMSTKAFVKSPSGAYLTASGDAGSSVAGVIADDDAGSSYFEKKYELTEEGTYEISVEASNGCYAPCQYDVSLTQGASSTAVGSSVYTASGGDVGKTISCKVSDSRGRVTGSLQSGSCSVTAVKPIIGIVSLDKSSAYIGDTVSAIVSECNIPEDARLYEWSLPCNATTTQDRNKAEREEPLLSR